MGVAYWISPNGEILDVKTKHIDMIIENPDRFGFTSEFIEFVYDHYNEKVGQEGKAREQLLLALFNQNWIRIRKYKNFYTMNLKLLAGKAKSFANQWAKKILKGLHGFKEDDPYIPVNIDQKGKSIKTIDLQTLAKSDKFMLEVFLIEAKIEDLPVIPLNPLVNEMMNKRKSFIDYLNESSLSRIMDHVKNTENFGVMSPFRKVNSEKQNEYNYKELASLVRKKGYGFIPLRGGYTGDEGFFAEKSLFIPNITRKDMIEFGKKYDQHSVLHKNKDNFALIGTNQNAGIGKVLIKFDTNGKNINVDDMGDKFKNMFSQLVKGSHSGKKFLFKMQEKVETNMYYEKKYGPKWITIFE